MAKQTDKKPHVVWLEGVLDYFRTQFPHGENDPRRFGFAVGRQIVGLYLIEMLLQYALDNSGVPYKQDHNLRSLFMGLPRQQRRSVERKYKQLLNSQVERTFDVFKTVDSFLEYLGKNAITDTRYFWNPDRYRVAKHASILFATPELEHLIYALFIVLHNYPSKPIPKKYDTKFDSLAKAFAAEQQGPAVSPRQR